MWRYPLGSGGKRVCTRPLYLFVWRSSMKRSRMKLEGRDSGAGLVPVSGSAAGVVIIFDLTAVELRTPSSAGGTALGKDAYCTCTGAACSLLEFSLRMFRIHCQIWMGIAIHKPTQVPSNPISTETFTMAETRMDCAVTAPCCRTTNGCHAPLDVGPMASRMNFRIIRTKTFCS